MLKLGTDGLPVGRKKDNYINIGGVLHKRCTHCGNNYRLAYYYKLKYTGKGKKYETYQSWCKFCMIEASNNRAKIKKLENK